MGRKSKGKDIAAYLWHSEPKQVNATNGNWRIRYGYLDSQGKEHQTTVTLKTKEAVAKFLSHFDLQKKQQKRTATFIAGSDTSKIGTIADLVLAYAEVAKFRHAKGNPDGWEESTYKGYMGKIRNYIIPQLGIFRVWEVTSTDILDGLDRILMMKQAKGNQKNKEKNVTKRIVYDCKKVLSKAFEWAVERKMIEANQNPMLGIKMSAPKSKKRKVIPEVYLFPLLDLCEKENMELYVFIILMTVLSTRNGEIFALRWSDMEYDVERQATIIHVNKSLAYRTEKWMKETSYQGIIEVFGKNPIATKDGERRLVLKGTKTGAEEDSPVDFIYIDESIAQLLYEHKTRQEEVKKANELYYEDMDFIFAQPTGWPMTTELVNRNFRGFLKKLDVPNYDSYSIYCLRHFSITKKLEINGHDYVSLTLDSKHKRVETVSSYYERPEEQKRKKTASSLGAYLLNRDKETDQQEIVSAIAKNTGLKDVLENVANLYQDSDFFKQQLQGLILLYKKNKRN